MMANNTKIMMKTIEVVFNKVIKQENCRGMILLADPNFGANERRESSLLRCK